MTGSNNDLSIGTGSHNDDIPCQRILFATDHFDVIGVPRDSHEDVIRAEFRRRALEVHPDKNSSALAEKAFKRLQAAHKVLINADARKHYEEELQKASGLGWLAKIRGQTQRGPRKDRRLFVVRHGSRQDEGIDPPLDPLGKWQVEQMAAFFAEEATKSANMAPITVVICSPFKRAMQTAAPLAKVLNLPICIEWGFCDLLAHRWLYASDPLPTLQKRKRKSLPGYTLVDRSYTTNVMPEYPDLEGIIEPGNEKQRRKALQRHQTALEAVFSVTNGGSAIIVGHGCTHDFVADALCPRDHPVEHHSGAFCVPYCGISEVVEDGGYEGSWHLVSFGHTRWTDGEIPQRTRQRARDATQSTLFKAPSSSSSKKRAWWRSATAAAATVATLALVWHYSRKRGALKG